MTGLQIIPRARWFATHPAGFGPAPPASELWLHHSATRSAGVAAPLAADILTVQQLERIGQQRFGGGISYSYVVCASGRVFEGTGGRRKGSHTAGRNTVARSICLLGDHSLAKPTDPAIQAAADLVVHGRAHGWWTVDRLSGGHRDAPGAQTACPGGAAYACIASINRRALNGRPDVSLTGDQQRKLDEIHDEVTKRLDNRRAPDSKTIPGGGADTVLGFSANADGFGYRLEPVLAGIARSLTAIESKLDALAARTEDKP